MERRGLDPRGPSSPGAANAYGRVRLLPSGPGQVSPAKAVEAALQRPLGHRRPRGPGYHRAAGTAPPHEPRSEVTGPRLTPSGPLKGGGVASPSALPARPNTELQGMV